MAIELRDTVSLMQAMERITPPASFLLDTFFPIVPATAVTTKIAVEYRKRGRQLAPFVVRGAKGASLKDTGSKITIYQPPMMGPSKVVDPEELSERGFGENIYSTTTPAQRAAIKQAEDMVDLQNAIINRKAKMAADILQTGKCDIEGYADDGKTVLIDTIAFDFDHKVTPTTTWDKAGATIYSDIKNASELIQEDAGIVPTMMICGKNIADYLLSNDQIMKWMMVPTADNLSLMGFQPQIISPQITHVGRIKSLNLDVYTYAETYTDDAGKSQYFIDPDTAIIAIPGRGSQLHGACTLLNDAGTAYETFVAPYVPYYNGNKDTQVLSFYMYCRCVLAPQFVDDWAVIKAK